MTAAATQNNVKKRLLQTASNFGTGLNIQIPTNTKTQKFSDILMYLLIGAFLLSLATDTSEFFGEKF